MARQCPPPPRYPELPTNSRCGVRKTLACFPSSHTLKQTFPSLTTLIGPHRPPFWQPTCRPAPLNIDLTPPGVFDTHHQKISVMIPSLCIPVHNVSASNSAAQPLQNLGIPSTQRRAEGSKQCPSLTAQTFSRVSRTKRMERGHNKRKETTTELPQISSVPVGQDENIHPVGAERDVRLFSRIIYMQGSMRFEKLGP